MQILKDLKRLYNLVKAPPPPFEKPELEMPKPENNFTFETDYKICSEWGNRISFSGSAEISGIGDICRVSGHQKIIPEKGQTLLAEYEKGWATFVFTKVEPCSNPRDMFFADARLIGYKPKSDLAPRSNAAPPFK